MRVNDSQAYRKLDVTRERISRILELGEILLSFQTAFNLVNAAAVCVIPESISGLEPSSVITEPRCLKLETGSSDDPRGKDELHVADCTRSFCTDGSSHPTTFVLAETFLLKYSFVFFAFFLSGLLSCSVAPDSD